MLFRVPTFGFQEKLVDRIKEDTIAVDCIFRLFRQQQTLQGGTVTAKDKIKLRERLAKLDLELDRYLAAEYGVVPDQTRSKPTSVFAEAVAKWKATHQPFHWFVEFYGIMHGGGFSVVVGNPPYVATSKVDYLPIAARALKVPDLYGHVLLRSLEISSRNGRFGMIVPLSITFSEDFGGLRKTLCTAGRTWFSSYGNIPAALFAGVSQRCTIWVGDRSTPTLSVSPMYRWRSITRHCLIDNVAYTHAAEADVAGKGIPKLGSAICASLFATIQMATSPAATALVVPTRQGKHWLRFSQTARNFVSAFKEDPPYLEEAALKSIPSSKIGSVAIAKPEHVFAALSAVVGELYFWYWLTRGDGFDVTGWIVRDSLKVLDRVPDGHLGFLVELGRIVHQRRFEALAFKKNAGKYVGNFNFRGHGWLTRRADLVLLAGLGMDRSPALEVFNHVQRVLAINEFAGERAIPDAVKARYRPHKPDEANEKAVFAEADDLIRKHFNFTKRELDHLLYHDVAYRPGSGDDE